MRTAEEIRERAEKAAERAVGLMVLAEPKLRSAVLELAAQAVDAGRALADVMERLEKLEGHRGDPDYDPRDDKSPGLDYD